MDFITSLGFGCSFPAFVVVVEGEGRGGVFEESGVSVGAIVSSSSSSNSVISLLALSFFNNTINVYLLLFFAGMNRICEKHNKMKKFAFVLV